MRAIQTALCAIGALAVLACNDQAQDTETLETKRQAALAESQPPREDFTAHPRPAKIDLELTQARRSGLESKVPEARGFELASDLEERLKGDESVDRNQRALEVFDRMAKGHWVLFTGPVLALEGAGFSLPLTWHRGSKRDSMGVTPSWIPIRFPSVRGHSTVFVSEGSRTAVLAKYLGEGRAEPAYDVIGLGWWTAGESP